MSEGMFERIEGTNEDGSSSWPDGKFLVFLDDGSTGALSASRYGLALLMDSQGEVTVANPDDMPRRLQAKILREIAESMEELADETGEKPLQSDVTREGRLR